MKYLPNTPYPDSEKSKLAMLEKLFRDWHQHFAKNTSALDKYKQTADDMVFDGFYPHYFSQKKQIVFIGRETLEMAGNNYIEDLYKSYRSEEKYIGARHLNHYQFHNRMFYIAYGILNGMPEWQRIDYADKLSNTFGMPDGLSFAFMNISKLSNESGDWKADQNLINAAYRLSTEGRNFIQEEIAILEPHILIAMNLGEKLDSLGKLSDSIYESAGVKSYWLKSGGHRSLLIDSWHFSAPGKENIADYYVPICDAIRRSEAEAVAEQSVGGNPIEEYHSQPTDIRAYGMTSTR
jgi:hypothetical protein